MGKVKGEGMTAAKGRRKAVERQLNRQRQESANQWKQNTERPQQLTRHAQWHSRPLRRPWKAVEMQRRGSEEAVRDHGEALDSQRKRQRRGSA